MLAAPSKAGGGDGPIDGHAAEIVVEKQTETPAGPTGEAAAAAVAVAPDAPADRRDDQARAPDDPGVEPEEEAEKAPRRFRLF